MNLNEIADWLDDQLIYGDADNDNEYAKKVNCIRAYQAKVDRLVEAAEPFRNMGPWKHMDET